MNIGFVVDHPKRDLNGAIRVAHAFAQRGASTYLIPLYDQGVDVPLLNLDVLIVNYARPINLDLVRGYVDTGLPVFVLDTEGGILSEEGANSPAGLSRYIAESGYRELLAGYFFWGSLLRDAFIASGAMPINRLHITGCPRFDFASPRWEATLGFPRHGYVLVNANFPLVNPRFASSADEESLGLVKGGWSADYVVQMLADQRQILSAYLDAVYAIAKAFPERDFLIRPHPFENSGIYDKKFADLQNVAVDGAGNVLNVMRHSSCVIHLNCGTAIEAIMLQRVPISMEFLNTPHMANHSTLPSKISLKAVSQEALHAIVADIATAEKTFDFQGKYRAFIHPYFHENDGSAGDRVVEVVLGQLAPRQKPGMFAQVRSSLRSSRLHSRLGQRFQAVLANLLGSAATARLRALRQRKRRDKFISIDMVRLLLEQLAQHDGCPAAKVCQARHPITGLPLSSLRISP